MNIYKVERTDKWGYDDYNAFVCVAENEEQARWMVPDECYVRKDDGQLYFQYSDGRTGTEPEKYPSWAKDINDIKVTQINPTEPEVILASFNAG